MHKSIATLAILAHILPLGSRAERAAEGRASWTLGRGALFKFQHAKHRRRLAAVAFLFLGGSPTFFFSLRMAEGHSLSVAQESWRLQQRPGVAACRQGRQLIPQMLRHQASRGVAFLKKTAESHSNPVPRPLPLSLIKQIRLVKAIATVR